MVCISSRLLLFITLHLNFRQKRHLATRFTHPSPSKRFPTKTSLESNSLHSIPSYPVLTGGAERISPGSSRRSALQKEYVKSYEPIAKHRLDFHGSSSAGNTRPKKWSSRTQNQAEHHRRAPQQERITWLSDAGKEHCSALVISPLRFQQRKENPNLLLISDL